MDPKNTVEMLKYLEKQNELLMEAKDKMTHELHKLQVEEKMLMRKFYEMTTALGLNKKNEVSGLISNEADDGLSNALTNVTTEEQ